MHIRKAPQLDAYYPNNRAYTTPGAIIPAYYYSNTFVDLSANYCGWKPSTGTNCTVCFGGIIFACICIGSSAVHGIRGTFTMVPCDLDERAPVIVVFSCIVGAVFLHKRRKIEAANA